MPRPKGFKLKDHLARFEAIKEELCIAYLSGESALSLSRKYGFACGTVTRFLRAQGFAEVEKRGRQNAYGARGPWSRNWKGGRHVDKRDGYVSLLMERNDPFISMASWAVQGDSRSPRVPEHRLVMARHIGRPLERHETVHHLNGVRHDNRIENLQLRSGRHGTGVIARCRHCGSEDIAFFKIGRSEQLKLA